MKAGHHEKVLLKKWFIEKEYKVCYNSFIGGRLWRIFRQRNLQGVQNRRYRNPRVG